MIAYLLLEYRIRESETRFVITGSDNRFAFEGKETNDSKRTFSIHEFDCLRFNSGYAGRACGKFCFVFVAFKLEFAQKNKSIFESLPFKDIDEDVIC